MFCVAKSESFYTFGISPAARAKRTFGENKIYFPQTADNVTILHSRISGEAAVYGDDRTRYEAACVIVYEPEQTA